MYSYDAQMFVLFLEGFFWRREGKTERKRATDSRNLLRLKKRRKREVKEEKEYTGNFKTPHLSGKH